MTTNKKKKILVITIFLIILVISFLYHDKKNYFIGKSIFNYKELPLNIRPGRIEYSFTPSTEISEFYLRYNNFEYFGKGFGYVYNEKEFQEKGYESKNKFSVSSLIGYYYNKKSIIAICIDDKGNKRYVKPFYIKGDIVFLEVSISNLRDSDFTYVNVQ